MGMPRADHAHLLDNQPDQVNDSIGRSTSGATGPSLGQRLCVYDLWPNGLLLCAREGGDGYSCREVGQDLHLARREVSRTSKIPKSACYHYSKSLLNCSSFFVQAVGGIMDSDFSNEMDKIGLHIYTAGIAAQQFFILCFCGLLFVFHRHMRQGHGDQFRGSHWHTLVLAMYATLGCIAVSSLSLESSDKTTGTNLRIDSNHLPFG